jgi:hypothetical protein
MSAFNGLHHPGWEADFEEAPPDEDTFALFMSSGRVDLQLLAGIPEPIDFDLLASVKDTKIRPTVLLYPAADLRHQPIEISRVSKAGALCSKGEAAMKYPVEFFAEPELAPKSSSVECTPSQSPKSLPPF